MLAIRNCYKIRDIKNKKEYQVKNVFLNVKQSLQMIFPINVYPREKFKQKFYKLKLSYKLINNKNL